MTQLLLISFILLHATISTVITEEASVPIDHQCALRKAQETACATDCNIDKCPMNKNYSRMCDKKNCTQGCKCAFNEKFASNGTCIATELCPPFDCDLSNEEYVACPPFCGDGCLEQCPIFGVILIALECSPECRCKTGFGRKAGVCVRSEEC